MKPQEENMSLEQIRAQIASNVWQAIAQSGIDLSSVPQDQQEKLVRALSDRLMVTMNSMLDEMVQEGTASEVTAVPQAAGAPAAAQAAEAAATGAEQVLWKGRPFLSLVENYTITSERIKIIHGFVGRQVENFELIRVQDLDLKQGVGERVLGIGDIVIRGQDPSNPEIILRNIPKPEEVYEILRRAWLEARKRYGLQFREYM
jgi:hypothetical protein